MWKKYIWQLGGCTVLGGGACAAGYLAWKNNIFKTSQGNVLPDSNDLKNNQDSEKEKSEINSDLLPNTSIEEQLSSEKTENTGESLNPTSNAEVTVSNELHYSSHEDQTETVVVTEDYEQTVTTDTDDDDDDNYDDEDDDNDDETASVYTDNEGSFQVVTESSSIVEDRQTSTSVEQANVPEQSTVSQYSVPAVNNQNHESSSTAFYEFEATNPCDDYCFASKDAVYELTTYTTARTIKIESIYSISSSNTDNKRQLNKIPDKQQLVDGQKYVIEISNDDVNKLVKNLWDKMDIFFGNTSLTEIKANGFTKFVP